LAERAAVMRALIVDDEAPARDKLRRWLAEQADVVLVGEAADGASAVQAIGEVAPDIVFLDIQMPVMSGIEVAAQLQATTAPLLVFVTAHGDHALQAFDLNAIDYLLKPYDKERFVRSLTRVRTRFHNPAARSAAVQLARAQRGAGERLLVPDGEQLRLVESRSIEWLEANDNYVGIHAGNRTYQIRRTLQDLLLQLGERQFARVHKSAAVNVAEILTLHPLFKGDYEIELRSGARIRMSRRYREAVFALVGR
jgi:two-component system, LytTR family, response regulator